MKKFVSLLILLPWLMVSFFSCQEENIEIDYNPNVKSSKDMVFAEDILFEITNVFFTGITDQGVMEEEYNYVMNCGIEYHPEADSIYFHYGDVNRYCDDNKFRRGAMLGKLGGPIFTTGSTATLVMDSLFVDEDLIEGTIHCEFLGTDLDGKQGFAIVVDSVFITLHDTTSTLPVIRFSCNYTLTWEQGSNTPDIHEDDMLLVSGTMDGKSVDGYDFQSTVTDPLVDDLGCFWVVSGIHQITTPSGQITQGTIDYIADDLCNFEVNFFFGDSFFFDDITH